MRDIFQVIKDPVHGSMQFTQEEASWIMPFIDSELFQRLRHIKQAGLCDWFFPGAVHTRFNHSIGCCYVASQIANKLKLPTEQKQIVMLACLLHDIGHGPFSHVFEPVFYKKCVKHEMWTPYFLKEFSEESFLTKLNQQNRSLPITAKTLKQVAKLIMHEEQGNNKLLADIVSSQLDADRLDYLLRDSYFCGVSYGQYDFRWLLHCLTIIENDGQKRLGVNFSGVGVVEHYLLARRLMTQNVYQHTKKYATEFLLVQFLKYLAEGLLTDKRFDQGVGHKTLTKFIIQLNEFNKKIRKAEKPEQVIQQFLKNNYDLYKKLCDYDVFSMIRHCAHFDFSHPAVTIAKRLQQRDLPKAIRIHDKNCKQAKELIAALKNKLGDKLADWQLAVLSMPHQSYQGERDPILVRDEQGKIKRLHDRSIVMQALSDRWENASMVSVDTEALNLSEVRKLCEQLRQL